MSGLLKKIFSSAGTELVNSVGGVLDNIFTSDEEKTVAKQKITEVVNNSLGRLMELQSEALQTEMKGNWLQRSWRPLVMLTFTAMIVIGAFLPIPYLETTSPFWSLLELGLGGYVIGRSVEKVSESVTKNVDLSFLKKKDRKDAIN